MPVSLTLNGVAFADPSTPGYFPGLRVVVEVSLTVSDPTIALIDAQQGGEYIASITPTLVRYRSAATGAVLGTGSLTSTSVKFHSLQRSYPTIGRLVSLLRAGPYYTGSALCTVFAVVGASIVADPAPSAPPSPDVGGLYARYYNNRDLVGLPVFAGKDEPYLNVGRFGPPHKPGLVLNFSARWTGFIRVPTTGKWQLGVSADDGVRLFFQGLIAVDRYNGPPGAGFSGWLDMSTGVDYAVWIEYQNDVAEAGLEFVWQTQDASGVPSGFVRVPTSAMYASLPTAPAKSIVVDTRHSGKLITRY